MITFLWLVRGARGPKGAKKLAGGVSRYRSICAIPNSLGDTEIQICAKVFFSHLLKHTAKACDRKLKELILLVVRESRVPP